MVKVVSADNGAVFIIVTDEECMLVTHITKLSFDVMLDAELTIEYGCYLSCAQSYRR